MAVTDFQIALTAKPVAADGTYTPLVAFRPEGFPARFACTLAVFLTAPIGLFASDVILEFSATGSALHEASAWSVTVTPTGFTPRGDVSTSTEEATASFRPRMEVEAMAYNPGFIRIDAEVAGTDIRASTSVDVLPNVIS